MAYPTRPATMNLALLSPWPGTRRLRFWPRALTAVGAGLLLCLALAGGAAAQGSGSGTNDASSASGPIRLRQGLPDDAALQAPNPWPSSLPGASQAAADAGKPADAAAERTAKPTGEFEAYVRLPRFGTDLVAELASANNDFSPVVPPDYVLQSGDEVALQFWGSVDADLRLLVDRTGRISIPRVGAVMVAGQRLADLHELLTRRTALVFKNFELSVSLGRLRGVRVYVTGYVKRPGAYVLSSLSTAMNAVMRAGGPADSGSFRQVELRRGDKLVAKLDLYDLLLRGDKGGDSLVQPGDVVHVVAVGPLVAIKGSINRPAIYELNASETLGDALKLAGGFGALADRSRIAIERLEDRNDKRVVEWKLPDANLAKLSSGDVLRVFSGVDAGLSVMRQNKRIKVEGEVGRPGEFVLPPNSSLNDALRAAGGTTSSAYLYGAVFTRESVRQVQQENYDRALRDFETQLVRTGTTQRVTTADEASAQAASNAANERLIDRLRSLRPNGRIVLQLTSNAAELPDLILEDGDRLLIPPRANTVGVFGSVFSGGSYLYSPSRTVGDYLNLAGGPSRGADQSSVFVIRANGTVSSSPQTGGGLFSRGPVLWSVVAEPGDTVYVPEELNKTTFVQNAKDWTQILYQFGLGIAGLKSAFR